MRPIRTADVVGFSDLEPAVPGNTLVAAPDLVREVTGRRSSSVPVNIRVFAPDSTSGSWDC